MFDLLVFLITLHLFKLFASFVFRELLVVDMYITDAATQKDVISAVQYNILDRNVYCIANILYYQ